MIINIPYLLDLSQLERPENRIKKYLNTVLESINQELFSLKKEIKDLKNIHKCELKEQRKKLRRKRMKCPALKEAIKGQPLDEQKELDMEFIWKMRNCLFSTIYKRYYLDNGAAQKIPIEEAVLEASISSCDAIKRGNCLREAIMIGTSAMTMFLRNSLKENNMFQEIEDIPE